MTAIPRSLFGRLALLMIAVTAMGFIAALLIFRYDRASMTERNFSDTKIVQIETLRAALASMQQEERPGFLRRLGKEYGVRLVPVADRPVIGRAPRMANAWFAFGHGHVGMCAGASTGREVAHLVAGRPTQVDLQPFAPDRF